MPNFSWPIAEVVILKQLDRVFHYSVPEAFQNRLEPGMRVLVPFRNDRLTGIVTRRLRRTDVTPLKPILDLLDPGPLLSRPMMALARWLSDYYLTGWGIAMKTILPPGLEAKAGRRYRLSTPSIGLPPPQDPPRTGLAVPGELNRAVRLRRFAAICLEGEQEATQPIITALIHQTLGQGRSVILLVPEIGLVAGWVNRLQRQGLDSIGILHSGLPDRNRRAVWEQVCRGEVPIVVGTRLAVFAPLSHPGLIVVEDEQDMSYKQEESPRYHARDVAVLRAARYDAVALLTTPSPSVETYAGILNGKYQSVRLDTAVSPRRANPAVRIIDLSRQPRGTFVSDELLKAVTTRIEKKEPVVLLLNQKGYGTALYCRDCGRVARCHRCEVAMVYSKRLRRLTCHYCGTAAHPPAACPECRGTDMKVIGYGTEQAVDFFRAHFPSVRIACLDRDTTKPGEVAAVFEQLNRSELDMILGTQLLLKGPGTSRSGLIGLLQADGAFHHPDFRAGEQTFQWVARILTFARGSEVILQTYHPAHPGIAWAVRGDPKEFYEKELAQRKAVGYPPFTRLAVVTVKALKAAKAAAVAERLGERLRQWVHPAGHRDGRQNGLQILGPAPAIRSQRHGKYRYQILIKASGSRILHRVLRSGLRSIRSEPGRYHVWFEVDVDPLRIV